MMTYDDFSLFHFSSWSLGEANSRLSYYDGLIQLTYSNGSQYNNKEHTLRSTLISFLCDPEAGAGKPDFQVTSSLFPLVVKTVSLHAFIHYICSSFYTTNLHF